MAYKYGHFVWFELVTPDIDAGKAFWSEVVGFKVKDMDMGGTTYTMLATDAGTTAGVVKPRMEGLPPHVTSYISVDDVAAKARAVKEAGGKVIVEPTDIGMGIFALVADPDGATFNLWHSKDGDDQGAKGVHWNELHTSDPDKALTFYKRALGLTSETVAMPNGPYHMLKSGKTSIGGVMKKAEAKIPSMWLPYFEVKDVAEVVARVKTHGGTVRAEAMEVEGVGRFAIVADREGATAGVIKPAPRE